MFDALTPTDQAEPYPAPDPAVERAERHGRVLRELSELGLELARALQAKALAQLAADEDAAGAAETGQALSRVARMVRQSLALEDRLAKGQDLRRAQAAAERAARAADAASREGDQRVRVAIGKHLVAEAVEAAIEAQASPGDAERLLDDLYERLNDPTDDADFADRPVGEMVERLCRGLGLMVDLGLWEDEDWAVEESETRPPGSPYAARREPPDAGWLEEEGEVEGRPP